MISQALSANPTAQAAFDAGDLAAALVELNAATEQKKYGDGFSSVAMMADHCGQTVAAKFLVTMQGTISALMGGTVEQQAQAVLIDSFLSRFTNSMVDFANEELRTMLTGICLGAGWEPEELETILALGYSLESPAQKFLNRPATLNDLTTYKELVAADSLRHEYDSGQNLGINQAIAQANRANLVAAMRALADQIEGV